MMLFIEHFILMDMIGVGLFLFFALGVAYLTRIKILKSFAMSKSKYTFANKDMGVIQVKKKKSGEYEVNKTFALTDREVATLSKLSDQDEWVHILYRESQLRTFVNDPNIPAQARYETYCKYVCHVQPADCMVQLPDDVEWVRQQKIKTNSIINN